jgi:hypothetical protein
MERRVRSVELAGEDVLEQARLSVPRRIGAAVAVPTAAAGGEEDGCERGYNEPEHRDILAQQADFASLKR